MIIREHRAFYNLKMLSKVQFSYNLAGYMRQILGDKTSEAFLIIQAVIINPRSRKKNSQILGLRPHIGNPCSYYLDFGQ